MDTNSPSPLTVTLTPAPISPLDTKVPSPRMSERYRFIPTREYLDAFQLNGWEIGEVRNVRSSRRDPQFAKHMVTLFRRDIDRNVEQSLGGLTPRIHLINSHDGSSRLMLIMGILRVVCSNGLMVSSGEVAQVSFRHDSSARETSDVVSNVFASDAMAQIEKARRWADVTLSQDQQLEFASAAKVLRFGLDSTVEAASLLEARRAADQGSSLWNTFNRIQENVMQGGIRFHGMRRRARRVVNIDKDVTLNRGLWSLAETFAAQS